MNRLQTLRGIALLLIAFLFLSYSFSNGYKRFSKHFDTDELIKHVKPDKDYSYWAFCGWSYVGSGVIYSNGKKPDSLKLEPSSENADIFVACKPMLCYKYIVYVDDGKVHYVTQKKDFGKFLGHIDNLEEAVLLATATQGLAIDEDNRNGGEYMITKNGYNLHLMHFVQCPESRESILVKIDKDAGIVKKTKLSTYYKGKGCIVY